MKIRSNPIQVDRANNLGAHAAESENQIRWALAALARGDVASARERLKDAEERCAIIRETCYWEAQPVNYRDDPNHLFTLRVPVSKWVPPKPGQTIGSTVKTLVTIHAFDGGFQHFDHGGGLECVACNPMVRRTLAGLGMVATAGYSDPHRRVVEAELAQEALATLDAERDALASAQAAELTTRATFAGVST